MKKTLYWGIGFLVIFIFAQAGTACYIDFGDVGIVEGTEVDNDHDFFYEQFDVRINLTAKDGCSYSVYVVFKDDTDNVLGEAGPWTVTGNDPTNHIVTIYDNWFTLPAPDYVNIWMYLHPRGDVNSDAAIDLQDTILFLKGLTAVAAPGAMNPGADANDDTKLNMEDAIYTLQILSGLKEPVELTNSAIFGVPLDTP